MTHKIIRADATASINLETLGGTVDLTFLDPPFATSLLKNIGLNQIQSIMLAVSQEYLEWQS